MNMVLEKNIPAEHQRLGQSMPRCTETVCDGFCSILRSILRYGGADRPENNVQHQHLLLFTSSQTVSFVTSWTNKKNRNNTRETTTHVFLTKGKRQEHLSGTIFLTSIPPHSLNLLSSQVIPANYPADVFGKIKESNQSNTDESAFTRRSLQQRLLFPSRAETTQKKQSTVMQSI